MNNQPVAEPQKFASDILWVGVSHLLMLLTQLVTLVAITKNYSLETYGAWAQMAVTVTVMVPVLTLTLGNATVRFLAAEDDTEKRRHVFGAMLWPVLAFVCLVLVISLLLRQSLSIFLFAEPEYAYLVPLTFLWASVEALFSFSLSYLLASRKIRRYSVILLAFTATRMAVIVTLVMAGYSLGWIIVCIIAGVTVLLAVVFGMIVREIGLPKPAVEGLKGYLAFSVPQIPSGIVLWVIDASNKYFITHLLNLSQTGTYSASYTIGLLISVFYFPIHVVLFPTVSRLWEQKELSRVRSYFEYSNKVFLAVAIPGAAGLYILSQPLLAVFTSSDYMVGGGLVLLIALGIMLFGVYQINLYAILLVQQTKWLPLMVAIAVLTNAGINLALIPKIGIMGAAISTIVSYFILAAIVIVWSSKVISYRLDFRFLAKVIAGTLLMAFCLSFINIGGILGIIVTAVAGVSIFALALWLLRAFSSEDKKLIKEIILGSKSGALLR